MGKALNLEEESRGPWKPGKDLQKVSFSKCGASFNAQHLEDDK